MALIYVLEPAEYDRTYNLFDQYTRNTLQSHQSGIISQSMQQLDQLTHDVVGGEFCEDGQVFRGLSYNAVFSYSVTAVQYLHTIEKTKAQLQTQIGALKQHCDKLTHIILDVLINTTRITHFMRPLAS